MSTIGLALKRHGLACALVAPLFVGFTPSVPRTNAVAPPSANNDPSGLPLAAQASISAVLGRDDVRYQVIALGDRLHADNPNHALAADFTEQGLEVRSGTARWRQALSGYGYGQSLNPVSAVTPQASANRVEYRRGALTEWYVNGPLGLEQGFTLEAPPGPRPRGQALTLALAISGDVQPTRDADGAGLTLHGTDGAAALRYAGLSAFDATGRELPVWLELDGTRQLRLLVDDAGAQYPLVVDPLVQTAQREWARLFVEERDAADGFGFATAIRGNTIVVGAPYHDSGAGVDQGAAYVFVKPVNGWSGRLHNTAALKASDGMPDDQFGYSVAISGDKIVVGAPYDTFGNQYHQGSAYLFVEPEGGWRGSVTQILKLTVWTGEQSDRLGTSVAINGNSIAVGAPGASNGLGTVYVFAPWSGYPIAELMASDGAAFDLLGNSVAISGDTVVAAVPYDDIGSNTDQGSLYVFVAPPGGWVGRVTEAAKLTASEGAPGEYLGYFPFSLGMSGDTVVVGTNSYPLGFAYVFVEPAGGWAGSLTETAELVASDGAPEDEFGLAVAISGNRIVVGAHGDDIGSNQDQGSAYVYLEPPGGWDGTLTETVKLTGPPGTYNFGVSLAISGQTLVVSAATGLRSSAHVTRGLP